MFFKNRSFNVKVVKDGNVIDDESPRDAMEGVMIAQAYAEVLKDVTTHVGEIVVTTILVKTACDLMKIGAKAISR